MGSAHDCPSLKLGFCQAFVDGKHVCYARKSETEMRKEVEPFRNKQKAYWLATSAEKFVVDFLVVNQSKVLSFNALRLNESGDFWGQECVDKAESIARMLKRYGVIVYCYTSRKDLDFSNCKRLIVSGSGFKTEGMKNIFKMITDIKDKPKGYGVCPMDCKTCNRCQKSGLKTVIMRH